MAVRDADRRLGLVAATWGQFLARQPEGINYVTCGLCLLEFRTPRSKAAHLIQAHDATVSLERARGGDLFTWSL